MNKRTLRVMYKWSLAVTGILLAVVLWDQFVNDSAWFRPLVITLACFVVVLLAMLFLGSERETTLPAHERDATITLYGKEPRP